MTNTLPQDGNNTVYEGLRDVTGLQFVAKQSIGTTTTDGSSVKSAAEATGSLDGAHATTGTTTDAAYVSGAGTLVALLKGIFGLFHKGATTTANSLSVTLATDEATLPISGTVAVSNLPGTQPVSGSVTANAGTNLNTSALALETGGNLATLVAHTPALGQAASAASVPVVVASDQSKLPVKAASGDFADGALATVGAQADAAYSGSGSGTLIALQKWLGSLLTSIKTSVSAFTDTTTSGTVTNDGDTVAMACPGGQATAVVQITGTFVGTLLFEGSADGGTTWVGLMASSGSTVGTSATAVGNWRVAIVGYTNVRVRLHPTTSGTASIRINLSAQPHNVVVNNATALGQATMANSAPVVLASDETVPVQGQFKEVIGQGTGAVNAINTDIIPSTDVSAYKWLAFHVTGTFSLSYTFQASNDNANWVSVPLMSQGPGEWSNSSSNVTSATTNLLWAGAVTFRYFRIRATVFTSNTSLAATLELYSIAPPLPVTTVRVMPGNTQNTTPWLMQGPTSTATAAANAGTGKAIKASAGALWSAVVTVLGTGTMTLYDNAGAASGTPLLVIPASAAVGTIYNFAAGQPAANGIYADQLANAPTVTVAYR